jgi:hypothetical protein
MYCSVLLKTRNVSDKGYRENENAHFIFHNFFFENCTVGTAYEIMWKNTVEPVRQQVTIQYGLCALYAGQLRLQTHLRICNTSAFSLPQRLHERAPVLRYKLSTLPILLQNILSSAYSYASKNEYIFILYYTNKFGIYDGKWGS